MKFAAILLVATLIALGGCSANRNSIYRHAAIVGDDAAITVVDAKQRLIVSNVAQAGGVRRFCSEPSPDVFSVVAQALSAGGTLGKGADPSAVQAALSAAFSSSEQGTSIARTQTINMLKEVMFRTCERFLNGGIGANELPIQAVRDQRLMVSILAIEQLTGSVGLKPVVVGATASGTAGGSSSDAVVRLDDANKALQSKLAAQQTRQAAMTELNKEPAKDCDVISAAVKSGTEASLSAALKDKKPKCEEAALALSKAKSDATEAQAHYTRLAEVAAAGGFPAQSGANVGVPVAVGGIDTSRISDMATVSGTVERIVQMNFDQDELMLLCLKPSSAVATPATGSVDPYGIGQTCQRYLESKIELETQRNKALLLEFQQAMAAMTSAKERLFAVFWNNISTDGSTADPQRLVDLEQRVRQLPSCMRTSKVRSEFKACFDRQISGVQRELGEAP